MEELATPPSRHPSIPDLPEDVKVVSQIMKLTQKEMIKWHAVPFVHSEPTSPSLSQTLACYEAEYKGNTLRLSSRQVKRRLKENVRFVPVLRLLFSLQRDKDTGEEYLWQSQPLLELIAPNASIVWSAQHLSILDGLEASVRRQINSPAYKSFVQELFAEG